MQTGQQCAVTKTYLFINEGAFLYILADLQPVLCTFSYCTSI